MAIQEHLPPNFAKLDTALRSIGYSFEAAVADIIDNSIDAGARNVMVRLILNQGKSLDLVIWDDGQGMTDEVLKTAMQFGSDVNQEVDRLGKFGLGLKLASLSQAKELKVIAKARNTIAGRGWLEDGLKKGFISTVFSEPECQHIKSEVIPDIISWTSGSAVIWSNLYRVKNHSLDQSENAQKLIQRLRLYLSLAFHRFLSGRPRLIKIHLEVFERNAGGIPTVLTPLDPFKYPHSGHPDFPLKLNVPDYGEKVKVKAHIWPPNLKTAEYRLPGGSNARQGFYFYRNNRLIQGGGWNTIREPETHMSLARVEVDLDPQLDVEVSLDVKKSEIQLPTEILDGITSATSNNGVDFKKYLGLADKAYRKRKITEAELPIIPASGIPAQLRRFMDEQYLLEKTKKHRDLRIAWAPLPHDQFFDIPRDEDDTLYINQHYRRKLLRGRSASSADLPVIKCLLFLLLKDVLCCEKWGSKIREKIDEANRVLVQAVKYEG